MGFDARIRYTKMVIEESFAVLVAEKPFHSITLKEVCECAQINRSTFYKYYKDTYDWKEQMEQTFLDSANALVAEGPVDDVEKILCQQFTDMKENAKRFRMVASPNFESTVMEETVTLLIEKTDEETRKSRAAGTQADFARRWDCYYLIKGCMGAMECWVNDGMQESPEALAAFLAEKILSSGGRPKKT